MNVSRQNGITSPVVIGGSGGSGTRVFAMLAISAGFYMGVRLNDSLDALDFSPFYEKWASTFLFQSRLGGEVKNRNNMGEDLQYCISRHLSGKDDVQRSWGWKNPRSMLVLPLLDLFVPNFRFIHVVRDGRDMAYSRNQNQLQKHGVAVLGRAVEENTAERAMHFWSMTNLHAAKYGEEQMGHRYLRVRFEDLCLFPRKTAPVVFNFLEAWPDDSQTAIAAIKQPSSIGRWTDKPGEEQSKLMSAGFPALRYFAYI